MLPVETRSEVEVGNDEAVTAPRSRDALQLALISLLTGPRGAGALGSPVAPGEPKEQRRTPDLRFVALGAACAAEDRIIGVVRAATNVLRALAGPAISVARPLLSAFPGLRLASAIRALDTYGHTVAAASSAEAAKMVEALTDDIARDPRVLHLVEAIVEQSKSQLVDAILPVALDRLNAEPDQVRALVMGQSRGAAEEAANAARTKAESGDQAVEAFLSRILHRRAREHVDGTGRVDGDGAQPTLDALSPGG
jgi:hypothetical protein